MISGVAKPKRVRISASEVGRDWRATQEELAAGATLAAACPVEQAAAIALEAGRPADHPPGPEELSADPAPVQAHGPAVRAVPPVLAAPAAVGAEDAAERGRKVEIKGEES